MTRGFGKGWQTPGLVVGRGCVCGGGLKGLWVPHRPCSPAPELRALRGDRSCGWRALVPVPGDLASPHLPGEWGATSLASRFALLASLLLTQHLPLGPLESVPVPELCQLHGRHPTPSPLGEGLIGGVFTPGGFGPSRLQLSFVFAGDHCRLSISANS